MHMQAVAVQLPEALTASFIGAAPHITVSFAQGSMARQAGTFCLCFCEVTIVLGKCKHNEWLTTCLHYPYKSLCCSAHIAILMQGSE